MFLLSIPFMGYFIKNIKIYVLLTTFNSLYGIPKQIMRLILITILSFNSLYGIQIYCLLEYNIKDITFNSLYGIRLIKEFLDKNTKTFNSLYGILNIFKYLNIQLFKYFQFPLWDTVINGIWLAFQFLFLSIPFMGYIEIIEQEGLTTVDFQFPLWDTKVKYKDLMV